MFYSIPNLTAITATKIERPWEYDSSDSAPPVPYSGGKPAMGAYSMDPATRHCYISMVEGMSELVRASYTDNAPFRIHGIIVDYDALLPEDPVEHIKAKPGSEFMPNWLVVTSSGNGRLIWNFEKPCMVCDKSHVQEFLRIVWKALRVSRWLADPDTRAYGNPCQYYEVGKEWLPIQQETCLSHNHVEMWMVQAASGMKFDTQAKFSYNIPLEDIAAEVRERYPGRWRGEFVLGSRGVRFWDSSADNPTGAVVRADGMQCFTGTQPFVSWRQIFGSGFVEKYEAKYMSEVVKDAICEGKGHTFWLRGERGWVDWSPEAFRLILASKGYKTSRAHGPSEVDNIITTLMTNRRADEAHPMLFYPPDIVQWRGKPVLNISSVKVMPPAPPFEGGKLEFSDGRVHFPFLYKFLKATLRCEDEYGDQLTAFLSWLKYFYVNSLNSTPRPGHCLVLAGAAGTGKTMLGRKILGDLMGGQTDGSAHMAEGSEWTSSLAGAPIVRIDDQLASSDTAQLKRFSARIKKYVANSEMRYNEKYKKASDVPWFGRLVVTCNTDSESMRILPDMDMSTADKIMLMRVSEDKFPLPDWSEIDRLVARELPNFARFLVDWEIPPSWIGAEVRFGVRTYHHPELLAAARQHGVGVLLEMLVPFLTEYAQKYPEKKYWEGTAAQLHVDLTVRAPSIMRDMRIQSMATQLGILARNGYHMTRYKNEDGLSAWRIKLNLLADTLRPTYERKEEGVVIADE